MAIYDKWFRSEWVGACTVLPISHGPASAKHVAHDGALLDRAQPVVDRPAVVKPAARRRRTKKGKVPSGLGRGLAGILEVDEKPTTKSDDASGALSLLLGASPSSAVATDANIFNKIHKFVIDAAVTAMVDGFNAEGAVVASRPTAQSGERDEALPNLSLRVPPSCSVSSPLMFALYGHLSRWLDVEASELTADSEQTRIGDTWVWLYRVPGDVVQVEEGRQTQVTVAATFRPTPFEQWETDALASLVSSVAFTLGADAKQVELRRKLKAGTTVSITKPDATSDGKITARIQFEEMAGAIDPGLDGVISGVGSATGSGADPVAAVAAAAASACLSERNVVFAGSSEVAGHAVTVVMLTEAGIRPRLGVAVHAPGDLVGVAEAVITASS